MPAFRVLPTKYIEWQITDFSNIPKETHYSMISPDFSVSGAIWYLSIYPNNSTSELENDTSDWVGLYLFKKQSIDKYSVSFRIGIKMTNGDELEYFEKEYTFRGGTGKGTPALFKRSALNKTENIVASDDSLTIFCSIRILEGPLIPLGKASQTPSSTATISKAAIQTPSSTATISKTAIQTPSQAPTLEASSQTSFTDLITEETLLESPSLDSMKSLVEDFKNIYNSGLYTDVTFIVKGGTISVHRSVLAARSPVFASMFKHDLAEKNTGNVEISDCDPDVFDQFLLYLYTGKIDGMTSSKAVHLYVTADKYNVKELKEECVRCRVRDVSVDSFCDVIQLAVLHSDSDLLEAATDFFISNLVSILPTLKWQDLLTEHPLLCNELLIKEVNHRMAKK